MSATKKETPKPPRRGNKRASKLVGRLRRKQNNKGYEIPLVHLVDSRPIYRCTGAMNISFAGVADTETVSVTTLADLWKLRPSLISSGFETLS